MVSAQLADTGSVCNQPKTGVFLLNLCRFLKESLVPLLNTVCANSPAISPMVQRIQGPSCNNPHMTRNDFLKRLFPSTLLKQIFITLN